ncbi:unnamed protein product [Caenorhabditis auriculariae]|uniref:Uncharacterized protein n=1 Tax=Caenorhabditis auriculariae TaxID=2777116 RepID=A0A8S1H6S1_9PELO|nr:unnamed protein product [Caenorhabditis auriculariae]
MERSEKSRGQRRCPMALWFEWRLRASRQNVSAPNGNRAVFTGRLLTSRSNNAEAGHDKMDYRQDDVSNIYERDRLEEVWYTARAEEDLAFAEEAKCERWLMIADDKYREKPSLRQKLIVLRLEKELAVRGKKLEALERITEDAYRAYESLMIRYPVYFVKKQYQKYITEEKEEDSSEEDEPNGPEEPEGSQEPEESDVQEEDEHFENDNDEAFDMNDAFDAARRLGDFFAHATRTIDHAMNVNRRITNFLAEQEHLAEPRVRRRMTLIRIQQLRASHMNLIDEIRRVVEITQWQYFHFIHHRFDGVMMDESDEGYVSTGEAPGEDEVDF